MALPEALGPSPPGTQPGLLLLFCPYGESRGDSDICSSVDSGQTSEALGGRESSEPWEVVGV